MSHSNRAKRKMTKALKGHLKLLQDNLKNRKIELAKAKAFLKYKLPGTKSMITHHKSGIQKTLKDITLIKKRIRRYQKRGLCYDIL